MALNGGYNMKGVGKRRCIKIGKRIGEGARSQIFEGSFQQKIVAVKSLLFSGSENEVEILRRLEHPNIIRIHFVDRQENTLYIVLDLCKYTLKQYVEGRCDITLPKIEVLRQVTEGLDYLHNGQKDCTVHRDLKPSNILFQYVDRDGIWRVKISDFGISKEFISGKTSTMSDLRGTSGFIAPELIDRPDGSKGPGKVRKATDIFSLGVIFYYVLSDGKHPFTEDMSNVNAKVRDDDASLCGLEEKYEHTAFSLIDSMIKKAYKDRITISEVKAHHLFWDANKMVEFLRKASNFLENRDKHESLLQELEKLSDKIFDGNWKDIMCEGKPEVQRVLEKRGPANWNSVQELMRKIRNWISHYDDKTTTKKLKGEVGEMPSGFLSFFTSRFPNLIPYTYNLLKAKKEEEALKEFYISKQCQQQSMPGVVTEQAETICERPHPGNEAIAMDVASSQGAFKEHPGNISEAIEMDTASSQDEMEDNTPDDDILEGALNSSDEEDVNDIDASGDSERNELVLRPYQNELAEQALNGNNSLIIAPTGSGKTAVANEIIKNHLQQSGSKSVIFLVSKTTLARQQFEFFTKFLSGCLAVNEIAYLIGELTSKIVVGAIIKKMRLTILTPQILINELNGDNPFISFHDISMMIFDECHNATKKHPYKVIMDMLLDFKIKNPDVPPIQIVGMTASPGVGKGKSRDEVLGNLITLLANLNVTLNPAKVEKNIKDLEKYQNKTEQNFIRVDIIPDRFTRKILEAMTFIENKIAERNIFGNEGYQFQPPPEEKDKQRYENWVMGLINHVRVKVDNREMSRAIILYANHLKMYFNVLYLKRMIPHALEATKHQAEFNQEGLEGRIVRKIYDKLDNISRTADVPMLRKLLDILEMELVTKEENGNSRCIIFVPRRMIAPALVEAIEDNDKLAHLHPKSLTGTNEHADIGGMTKADQTSALKAFRDGKCKILIATSVAEEGLDIRECNLVIMYNYVTGEVGRIQRAGRGRAENSRSILLTARNSEQIEREKMNEICALATDVAIEDMKQLSNEAREAKIKEVQVKQRNERLAELTKQWCKLQEAKNWEILCGQCKSLITAASNIRHINNQHRFVVDDDFIERVERMPCLPTPLAPGVLFEKTATFYCRKSNCRHYLGIEMQYKNKTYPTLTVRRLVFRNNFGTLITSKQWSKCPFDVEKAVDDDQEEVDERQIQEFLKSQAISVVKGFVAEDISEDDAKEAVNLANANS